MANRPEKHQRTVLPIPDQPYNGLITYDARNPDSKFPPIEPTRPPEGAPNVLVVLIDDVGFGASSAFGGPINTPNAERLASSGLKYNRFHTTALCSPTRAALLSGRNHHTVGMAGITEIATGAPGYCSVRPNTMAPIAETLRLNGYATAQFGKCHEVPVWEATPAGPFDHWPTGSGFEKFYGFIAGETSQWFPDIYDGVTPVETPDDPNYHFMPDMTDQAISWIAMQNSLAPTKPFFIYFAPGATHAPHHVPKEWADKYKGKFDQGWDKLREETFARQKELGVIPENAELTKRPEEIPAWDDMPEELKPVLRRQMEVYAGFMEFTDYHVGRLIDVIDKLQMLDNTLIYYIIGDNGASAEGTLNGTFNEMINFNGAAALETPEFLMAHLDELGGPTSYNHYAVGWAHAMDTPYQWTKQVASHFGGTRNGTIVHWPKGIKAKGEIRSQFSHVIDIAPTLLEVAGLPQPTFVHGVQQHPIEGVSMAYSFDDDAGPERHETQYFEMFCNRGIYHKGWTVVTRHNTPWELRATKLPAFDDDKWELYDTMKDWTQSQDLAKEMPEKLHELQRLWLIEAVRHGVLPLDDRVAEKMNPDTAGRPVVVKGKSQILFNGMTRLTENAFINIKNKSHSVTADVEIPESGAEGVIIAQGTNFGGWALYAKEGKLRYCYNFLGLANYVVEANNPLPAGKHQVRMEFAYGAAASLAAAAGGGSSAKPATGMGLGGNVMLYVDGKQVAEGRVEHTHATVFSTDSNATVGNKTGAPISDDFKRSGNPFNGRVTWVEVQLGDDDDTDHFLDRDELLRIAMARQ